MLMDVVRERAHSLLGDMVPVLPGEWLELLDPATDDGEGLLATPSPLELPGHLLRKIAETVRLSERIDGR